LIKKFQKCSSVGKRGGKKSLNAVLPSPSPIENCTCNSPVQVSNFQGALEKQREN